MLELFFELLFFVFRNRVGFEDSLQRRFGSVVFFDHFRAASIFVYKFGAGYKTVDEHSPLGSVEVVEHGHDDWIIEAFIAQVLPDNAPIFAFDVGVIVFMVFPGAGVLHRS